uniref:Uncharacterized protein n=1 Tax=Oryza brachyantha TaxID=4533 RepID=J3MTH9_ORYBR
MPHAHNATTMCSCQDQNGSIAKRLPEPELSVQPFQAQADVSQLPTIDAVSPFFGQTQRGPVGSSSFFLVYKRSEPLHLSPAITIVLHNSCSILARCVVSHHAIQSIKNAHDMLAKKETER